MIDFEEFDRLRRPIDDESMALFRRVMETESDSLSSDTFRPKFTWLDSNDVPRLTLFPNADRPTWTDDLARQCAMLTSAQPDVRQIIAITDSCGATSPTKHDGSDWGRGEMQEALQNKTVDADLVFEILSVTICRIDETVSTVSAKYDRNDDGTITFEDPDGYTVRLSDEQELGRVPHAMRIGLRQPKLHDAMTEFFGGPDWFGLSDTQARAHGLSACVKMVMQEFGCICMVGAATEEEAEVFKHSFDNGPFSEGIRAFDQDAIDELVQIQESWDLTPDPEEES